MSHDLPAYGLWSLVIINTAVFLIFAFSFTHPKTSRDWRSFGAFSAFVVALFAERYGFPLTIYLLSGWVVRTYPGSIRCHTTLAICGSRSWGYTATRISACSTS